MDKISALTLEECQKARMARDARFDGRFYVAVQTTGIFCRPICPANLPKEENVEYYTDKVQALQAGYRPCLRCRPDSAPSSWAWKGVETTFLRAMQMIERGELHTSSLGQMSQRLGISDRYLRKLFEKHLGMAPKQYALYQQLMFAKHLLHSSSMSITDIAYASGFNSVRRFNDAFKRELKLTPSQVRRNLAQQGERMSHIDLAYQGAFDWQHMLEFYRLRAIDGIELIEGESYQRRLIVNGSEAWIKAYPYKPGLLRVEFELEDARQLRALVSGLRRMFDLDADIPSIEQHLTDVAPQLITRCGIRIPGVWSTWEAGVRAILGQQVSIKAAIGQLNLLVLTLQGDHFPTAQEIAAADLSFLRMPQSRKETLTRFARYMCEHAKQPPSDWINLKGIGPWTINYALLRGASEPNCFLDSDLVVKKSLAKFPELSSKSVAPWGSYATFHCWSHA